MKRMITRIAFALLFLLSFSITSFAQAPPSIPYQAVARDTLGNIIANQPVSLRFSIHDSVINGTIVYQETQTATTNKLGLVTVNIGQGTVTMGSFSGINWGVNAKFMQVELILNGAGNYTTISTTQMLSVPYALYANTAGNAGGGSPSNDTIIQVSGTGQYTITSDSTTVRVIPGLSTTINVPANSLVLVQTYGGFINSARSVTAMINVGLLLDGNLYGTPAYEICYVTNTGSQQLVGDWSFSQLLSLSAGTHTIAIGASTNYISNAGATIGIGNAPGFLPTDELTVTILNK